MLGRPPKLSPELIEKLCGYIAIGNYVSIACKACGISQRIYYKWLEFGRDEIKRIEKEEEQTGQALMNPEMELYVKLVEDVERAEVAAETAAVATIRNSIIKGDVNSAFKYLAVRHKHRWSERRENINVNVNQEKTLDDYDFSQVSDEELRLATKTLEKVVLLEDKETKH